MINKLINSNNYETFVAAKISRKEGAASDVKVYNKFYGEHILKDYHYSYYIAALLKSKD